MRNWVLDSAFAQVCVALCNVLRDAEVVFLTLGSGVLRSRKKVYTDKDTCFDTLVLNIVVCTESKASGMEGV